MLFAFQGLDNASIEELQGSKIYTLDNFYADPHEVLAYILKHPANPWKLWEKPSNNGIEFIDRRHNFEDANVAPVVKAIASHIGQEPVDNNVVTNCMNFKPSPFNDYQNCYWAPHTDLGYTALIYLNEDYQGPGTNLYEQLESDPREGPEHFKPWRPRSRYRLLKCLEAKWNRLVLFDGKKFAHGMAVEDTNFFGQVTRINQAVFCQD
jgi:hypothetical protein